MPIHTRRASNGQNLDSLLDTMANVVGILVVVMAMTQITVGGAMNRIRAHASEEGRALQQQAALLEDRWSGMRAASEAVSLEAERLRAHAAALRGLPASDLDPAQTAGRAARARVLEDEVAKRRRALSDLRLQLSDLPSSVPAAKVVRLPDPRPAPVGARPLGFVARHGRVFAADLDALEDQLFAELATMRGVPPQEQVLRFAARAIGTSELRWHLAADGGGLSAELRWARGPVGEDRREIAAPKSAFRQALGAASPRDRYAHFHVWADSFDTYLEARRIAEEAGFQAGWTEHARNAEHGGRLTSGPRKREPVPID